MAGNSSGNKKVAAQLKERYGVDAQGRSLFHTKIGSLGGENAHGGGYFKKLKTENPERLAEISQLGHQARQKKRENERANAQD